MWINVVVAFLMFFSMGAETPSALDRDRIKVVEVNYEGELQDGEEKSFEIVVRYLLTSQETGTVMIGFNNGKAVKTMSMIDKEFRSVEKGEGEITFNITTTVKDWGSEGDFMLHVNLSDFPLPQRKFQPMAGDRYVLIPEKW
jgi:hypothetical protein